MNFVGAAKKASVEDMEAIAKDLGVETAAFRAVITIEAAGSGFDYMKRPKALFERHKFYHQLQDSPEALKDAVDAGLAYPTWGEKPYPKGSDAVYAEIDHAVSIAPIPALLSTSWGLGQIMGSNFKMAGCESVEKMVEEAKDSEAGQLRQMASYIRSAGLIPALKDKNWAAFARGYNGAGYAQNHYDVKLEAAYKVLTGTA